MNLQITNLIDIIHTLPKPCIIGISGFGGSGKSTLAALLGDELKCPFISVDSFFRDDRLTEYHLWEIVDYDRLEEEVLIPFHRGEKTIKYGNFNWKTQKIEEYISIDPREILIIEGVGLFRPELIDSFDYTIWIDCSGEEAIERGKRRDREMYHNPQDEKWDGIWKENDLEYLIEYSPSIKANCKIKPENFFLH